MACQYKKYWDIVGKNVCKEIVTLLNGGTIDSGWNETMVVPIPKVQNPEKLKDYESNRSMQHGLQDCFQGASKLPNKDHA